MNVEFSMTRTDYVFVGELSDTGGQVNELTKQPPKPIILFITHGRSDQIEEKNEGLKKSQQVWKEIATGGGGGLEGVCSKKKLRLFTAIKWVIEVTPYNTSR